MAVSDGFILTFSISEVFPSVKADRGVMKRQVLSASAKLYDALGFMAPVSIELKVFHQQLCKIKICWDDPLEGDILGKWQSLVRALHEATIISLPRYYFVDTSGNILEVNLHCFSDASTTAYAAVRYLVVTSKIGISTQLVAAKTRVAPLSQQTIPHLELLAALILARLIAAVATTLTDVMCITSIRC